MELEAAWVDKLKKRQHFAYIGRVDSTKIVPGSLILRCYEIYLVIPGGVVVYGGRVADVTANNKKSQIKNKITMPLFLILLLLLLFLLLSLLLGLLLLLLLLLIIISLLL